MDNFTCSASTVAAADCGNEESLIVVEGLSKRYKQQSGVTDVTLTLRAGEICGFVGANGGGKSTTLRMLAGILRPTGGSGRVLGCDLISGAAKIRSQVGYMSQRLSLYAELSVLQNLRFRAEVYGLARPRDAAEAAIVEFDLRPWADSPAGSLSGGWARRLQLAATLIHLPRLVLLDEPTAGLDLTARQEVWRRVDSLAAAGAGVIVCTHDLVEAERCVRVNFFANGRIISAGSPAEIVRRSAASAFLLSGVEVRRFAEDVAAIVGVVASQPRGEGLRVVLRPVGEKRLRRFAALHGVVIAQDIMRLEDAVLVWSSPMGPYRT
jgi:ABC-type multidrug transport system ATPase subunit